MALLYPAGEKPNRDVNTYLYPILHRLCIDCSSGERITGSTAVHGAAPSMFALPLRAQAC
jgi:hypothetical protein